MAGRRDSRILIDPVVVEMVRRCNHTSQRVDDMMSEGGTPSSRQQKMYPAIVQQPAPSSRQPELYPASSRQPAQNGFGCGGRCLLTGSDHEPVERGGWG
jgi:hypothetical protein